MVLSEDGEDDRTKERFEDLCGDLNMDMESRDEAWDTYERISINYTLEGDQLHWLACALYVSCRKTITPMVCPGRQIEGNCVSLTRLLRTAKLSLLEFFKKMTKWADMSNLPQEFRLKVESLEHNFAVSTVTFKKFEPIFLDIFTNPADEPPRPPKGRKQKKFPCTATELFNFCWTVFIQVKGNFPAVSDDLVNSYHLLLCCIDWIFANTLLSNRRDLLNVNFSGLPKNFALREYRPPVEVPCIIRLLCNKHDGLQMEAKEIKEHWFKPYIKKLFDKKTLKGKADNLMGVLEIGNFDDNSKAVNNTYEAYVLRIGDFDERIFLGEDANVEIGTPAKGSLLPAVAESSERLSISRNLLQNYHDASVLAPLTPLTGRRYLREKEGLITPVSTATQSVGRLQQLLLGSKSAPSKTLEDMFKQCSRNPQQQVVQRVEEMGVIFCEKFSQPADDHQVAAVADLHQRKLQLGVTLYYKVLEKVLISEQQRMAAGNDDKAVDLSVEESILESLAWKSDSPLWSVVTQSTDCIPSVEEVSLPSQLEQEPSVNNSNTTVSAAVGSGPAQFISSPILPPGIRRVIATSLPHGLSAKRDTVLTVSVPPPMSPSAADRFSSPIHPSQAKRRLFDPQPLPSSASSNVATVTNTMPMALITDKTGRQILIPVDVRSATTASPVKKKLPDAGEPAIATAAVSSSAAGKSSDVTNKPKRTGSLALFFRKVYHLASVRIRDLCEKLVIDSELCSQIWTCFEYCLMKHPELMKDRHIDQLIMCSIYVLAKVTGRDQSFQDIMRCYRIQPQAQSHIYRSVLLSTRPASTSASSSSTVKEEKRSRREKTTATAAACNKADALSTIRSTSTLPMADAGSQPPTPTRLAGTGTTFQFDDRGEERGDLIKFYNAVFVVLIKDFALKFSSQTSAADKPLLSPLPVKRNAATTSPRKVSHNHSVYVSPIKSNHVLTPHTRLLYCFNRSPSRDLTAINNMLQGSDKNTIKKRLPLIDEGASESPAKRSLLSSSPGNLHKRLEEVINERNATSNGSSSSGSK